MKISNVPLIIHGLISLTWHMHYATCKTYIWLISPKDNRSHGKTYIFPWPITLLPIFLFLHWSVRSSFLCLLLILNLSLTLPLLFWVLLNYQSAFILYQLSTKTNYEIPLILSKYLMVKVKLHFLYKSLYVGMETRQKRTFFTVTVCAGRGLDRALSKWQQFVVLFSLLVPLDLLVVCFNDRSEPPSVLLSPVCHPDTQMKDEMEIVTDAITALLIEGEAKLSPPWLGFVWTESMPRSD